MKLRHNKLAKTLLLMISPFFVMSCSDGEVERYEVLESSVQYHYVYRSGVGYYLDPEEVSFEVVGADPKNFKSLNHNYARDLSSVYHKGHALKKRDAATFTVIKRLVTADKFGVYLDNEIIKNSDGLSFGFISDSYAADKNQAYYMPSNFYKVIDHVDDDSFTELDHGYAKDLKRAYSDGFPIVASNPVSFEVVDLRFSKDNKFVYYAHYLIEDANPATFEALEYGFSKDDTSIFYRDKIIEGADYETFAMITGSNIPRDGVLAQDKHKVYSRVDKRRAGPLIVRDRD